MCVLKKKIIVKVASGKEKTAMEESTVAVVVWLADWVDWTHQY